MNPLATLRMALSQLRRHLLRSLLTALGIVIGVASVIALVTLGHAATMKVTADLASLGQNLLMVQPGADRHGPPQGNATPFTNDMVRALKRELGNAVTLAPTSSQSALVVNGNRNTSTQVSGSTSDYLTVRGYTLGLGRSFNEAENAGGSAVCVLGDTPRKVLFGAEDPLGRLVRIAGVPCLVVGTVAAKGQGGFGPDPDDFILMPLAAFQGRLAGNSQVSSILVTVAESTAIPSVSATITSILRARRHLLATQADDFHVQDMKEIQQTVGNVTLVLTALLGSVGAVSLLVGGIGIMNIMLVSVTERTREIGIRLAIGAGRSDVLLQFLAEAVALSLMGGLVGVALGLGGAWGATRALGLPFEVMPSVVALACGFSVVVGVGFGFLPARRAAQLNPIEALRHE